MREKERKGVDGLDWWWRNNSRRRNSLDVSVNFPCTSLYWLEYPKCASPRSGVAGEMGDCGSGRASMGGDCIPHYSLATRINELRDCLLNSR